MIATVIMTDCDYASFAYEQSLYNMLGEAYFKSERLKEAEHWYRQALTVKSDHIPAHLTYGKLLTRIVSVR